MSLPDFFVIGAPKAGTTALYHCLRQHPGIFMSPVKEPAYFLFSGMAPKIQPGPAGDRYHNVAVWRPADYSQLFAGAKAYQKKGEATPAYIRSSEAAHRIKDNIPGAKIIALLRHPAERAYSSFWFMVQEGAELAGTFPEALAKEAWRMEKGWFSGLYHKSTGFYYQQLRVWYDLFPRAQIKVYLYEDWNNSPQTVMADIFRFLDVDPEFQPTLRRSNVTQMPRNRRLHRLACHPERVAKKLGCTPSSPVCRAAVAILQRLDRRYNLIPVPPLNPAIRWSLTAEYREDILSLQELIGRDLSHWLN